MCVCVYASVYASGHADGIYILLLGYVSLNSPYIPLAVSCPVQSGHFNTLIPEVHIHTLHTRLHTRINPNTFNSSTNYLVMYYPLLIKDFHIFVFVLFHSSSYSL